MGIDSDGTSEGEWWWDPRISIKRGLFSVCIHGANRRQSGILRPPGEGEMQREQAAPIIDGI